MHPKIYSCSMFFNELDLLELKLRTLYDVVDYFVISESIFTHSGKVKPLYYLQNKNRFDKFKEKIIHQVVIDTPKDYTNLEYSNSIVKNNVYDFIIDRVKNGDWWDHNVQSYGRDTFEKECLIRPLIEKANDNDIILLSDLDEIVRPESLEQVLNTFNENEIYHFQHDVFYYFLNLQKDEPWYGTIAVTMKNFMEKSFCEMRTNKTGRFVSNGGWHFSYQGGVSNIRTKIKSFGEQSLNSPFIIDNIEYNVENALELNRDLYGRPCIFTIRDINDGTFPDYLVKHQHDIFKNMILEAS